jgi:Tol biopolymer transport system component
MIQNNDMDSGPRRTLQPCRSSRPRQPWWRSTLSLVAGAFWLGWAPGCATVGAGPPSGSEEKPDEAEAKAMASIGEQVKGQIVWSSSRVGNHDLFVMDTDGSHIRQITKGEAVDWFPRFSPDGTRILFTRSKKGWVFERDANTEGKWDIFTVAPDGSDELKVVDNASWGSWISNDEIVYARATRIYRRKLSGDDEKLLVDSAKVPELDGALMQQPEMSKDGKYIAITLRGSKRETGIWDIDAKKWNRTGEGCQINWTPSGDEIYWMHPTGNGGSRVLHMPIDNGKPTKTDADADSITLIDIPGRRSHEYFPQLSADGKWLVWAATQRGHDHDIADYEIYLWKVGAPPETATRLTYHSGNDRWPDIFIPGASGPTAATGAKRSGKPAKDDEKPRGGSADKADDGGTKATSSATEPASTSDEDADDSKSSTQADGNNAKSKKKKKAKRSSP